MNSAERSHQDKDRRVHERFPCLAMVFIEQNGCRRLGRVVNVSHKGLLLRLPPADDYSRDRIALSPSPATGNGSAIDGRVAWIRREPFTHRFEAGIELAESSEWLQELRERHRHYQQLHYRRPPIKDRKPAVVNPERKE